MNCTINWNFIRNKLFIQNLKDLESFIYKLKTPIYTDLHNNNLIAIACMIIDHGVDQTGKAVQHNKIF